MVATASRGKRASSWRQLTLCAAIAALVAGAAYGQGGGIPIFEDPEFFCALIVEPQPSGQTSRPNVDFNQPFPEYFFMHSSTHLQGEPATVKHAPGLYFTPPAPGIDSGFRSVVIVNNPDPSATVTATVQFYDTQGTPLAPSTTAVLPPEGSIDVSATPLITDPASLSPGLGSATVTADLPIVGATIHHTFEVPGAACDPDPFTPGAASMQQLQSKQNNATEVAFGPIMLSNEQSHDFLNGILPLPWVRNPTNQPNTIQITYTSDTAPTLGPFVITLPPNGSVQHPTIVTQVAPLYLQSVSFTASYLFEATSLSELPLVGEMILTDFFGPDADCQEDDDGSLMDVGARFRMGSAMMANAEALVLVNPELTYQVGNPEVVTFMGIWNTGDVDVGPVVIRYHDRNGNVLAVDNVPSLPPGQQGLIGPGLAFSPNYPAPGVFDGWVRISACKKGLIGWTMRQTEGTAFQKVYGETLHGTNRDEPGDGFPVVINGKTLVRKVKPVSQVFEDDDGFWWPGYTNFVNDSVGNIGRYSYRFQEFFGGASFGSVGFGGLRYANTSFTYEDELVSTPFDPAMVSGRVDHAKGVIKGIGAIGDPLYEWQFTDFVPFPSCSPDDP
ncbi:MAG: hypothetical protein AAF560_08260 [Acidobacteriota bacterium]